MVLTLCLFTGAAPSHAGFGPAATAREWCKDKTMHYLKKRGYIPYNWAATTHSEGDYYVTEGEWSVDVDVIKVECTSNKHLKKPSGKYKILGVEITEDGESAAHSQ